MRFIVTCIITCGAVVKLVYSSYGMAALPVLLIKGKKSLEDEKQEVSKSIESVRG